MVVYSKLAPSKKITDNMTLRKQIGSNVFKRQPFNYFNVVPGYYNAKYQNSMNYITNTGNGYTMQGRGSAAGSGGSEDVRDKSYPPYHNVNPDGTLNSNPTSRSEQRGQVQRQAIQNKINQLTADVTAMNFAGVDATDVKELFGDKKANDFIYNFDIVKRDMIEYGYLTKQGELAKANVERILTTSDVWDNRVPQGFEVSYSQLFPKAGIDASWKSEFVDVGMYFYELATNPFSPLDQYERQSAMALANLYFNGNTVSERDLDVGLKLVDGINGLDLVEMERHNHWSDNKDYFYDMAYGTGGTPSERKMAGEVYTKLEKGELLTPEERLFAEERQPWISTAVSSANFTTEEQKREALTAIMESKNYSPADKKIVYSVLNEGLTGEAIGYQMAMKEYWKARETEWKETFGFSPYDTAKLGGGGADIKKEVESKPPSNYTSRTNPLTGTTADMYKGTQGNPGSLWDTPGVLNPLINPLKEKDEVQVGTFGQQILNIWYSNGSIFSPGSSTKDVIENVNVWTRTIGGFEYDSDTGKFVKSNPTVGDSVSFVSTILSLGSMKGDSTTPKGNPMDAERVMMPNVKTSESLFAGFGRMWNDIVSLKNSGSNIGSTIYNGVKSLIGKGGSQPTTNYSIVQMKDGTVQILKGGDVKAQTILKNADEANQYIKANGLKMSDFKIFNEANIYNPDGTFKLGFDQIGQIPFEGGTYKFGNLAYRVFDKGQEAISKHSTTAKVGGGGLLGAVTAGSILKGGLWALLGINTATEPGSQSAFAAFIGGDTLNQLTSYKLIPDDKVTLLTAMSAFNGYNRVLNDLVLPMKNFQDKVEKLPLVSDFYNTYMPGWNNAKNIMDTQVNVQAMGAAEYYFSVGLWVNKHSGTRDFSNSDIILDGEFVDGKTYKDYLLAQEELSARINPYWSMTKIQEQKDRFGNPFNTTLFKADTYNRRYVKTEAFDTLYRAVEDDKAIKRYDDARKTMEIKPGLQEYIRTGKTEELLKSGRADIRTAVIDAAKKGEITAEQKNTILAEINKMDKEGVKGQGIGTGSGILQPNLLNLLPTTVAGEKPIQDVKPGEMSETQKMLSSVLDKATDISQVKQVADKFGLNIEGQMKFTTDKSLEGYKNAVLTVARDNENSPFTIDRSKVYAPPVTTQNRENYFTKVQQPQTISSKYVPQAATYGGNQAYQQQPSVSYDPSWSANVGDTSRPWLGTGQDVFSWSNNWTPPTFTQQDFNQAAKDEGKRIEELMFTPTVIDQTWGFAQLIDEINYNPIDNLKKDKKR